MDAATATFQKYRPRLLGLAYRMLGTQADAEDVLHDAWLRWHQQDTQALDEAEAWLVTVTTRLALDRLRRAKTERQHYTGPWLPEPLVQETEQPEAELERVESLNLSFLALLERLSPDERAAFLLVQVFDYSHAETAQMLQISEDACRQRVHRARQRLREGRPRFTHAPEVQRRLLEKFRDALETASVESLQALFAEDAVHLADGGGKARATLRPLHGAERVVRLYSIIAQRYRDYAIVHRLQWLNGAPALLTWLEAKLVTVAWIETDGERITSIHSLRNPEKLARLEAVTNPQAGTSLS
ncbi:RNA polymerase sigma factor SigJ [Dyella kyungheensis]|jgi:RNA polymerase sigma-70 factor (ECF subfamily)|uniref:RNA polymerase sigma factor SigJ n=1 Tax=Dyella kyungheensis TaxID=1242174 RepID=A0ABS2JKZ2_9GAMM|nr:RNA polymerase sigma factor SigJ [Dyella kyungheensis]MBM7119706.1 RNA polymerase sigma factor SigJ [Dyella kyungheensis]